MRRVSLLSLALCACSGSPASPAPPAVIDEVEAPATWAEAVCSVEHDCDCPQPAWPDRETCVAQEIQQLEDSAAIARAHGLHWDGECVARRVQAYDDAACERDAVLEPCALSCKPYVGEAARDEPCERLGITVPVDTCAQGLVCTGGRCVPACEHAPALPLGAVCARGIESLGECEPKLHCTSDTRRCAPRPALGEPCPDGVCVASARCDRAASDGPVCVAGSPTGASCSVDPQCESARCVAGECAAPAAAACSYRAE